MVFNGRSVGGKALLEASGSGGGVEEMDFLRNKDFLIIFYKVSIFFLYFVWTDTMVAVKKEITALKIECCITESIAGDSMLEMHS